MFLLLCSLSPTSGPPYTLFLLTRVHTTAVGVPPSLCPPFLCACLIVCFPAVLHVHTTCLLSSLSLPSFIIVFVCKVDFFSLSLLLPLTHIHTYMPATATAASFDRPVFDYILPQKLLLLCFCLLLFLFSVWPCQNATFCVLLLKDNWHRPLLFLPCPPVSLHSCSSFFVPSSLFEPFHPSQFCTIQITSLKIPLNLFSNSSCC